MVYFRLYSNQGAATMPGFFISNVPNQKDIENVFPDRCMFERKSACGFSLQRNTLRRFLDDKTLAETDHFLIISEGVIFNKAELYETYCVDNIESLILSLYKSLGDEFFNTFRGSFSGALYDKEKETWLIWTNHCGDNSLFYSYKNNEFRVGSQFDYVLNSLSAAHIATSIDEQAAYYELTFGFMEDDSTFIEEIKRLLPGSYIKIDASGFSCNTYWETARIGETESYAGESEAEVIDKIDELFRRAVKREFDKDIEYGYRHMSNLSGGMDSRMTTWVAHDMGYSDIVNTTFCQAGNPDEKIAERIAASLGNELIFKPLDEASFMFDVDIHVSMLYGLSLYFGLTGGRRLLQSINMDDFGLEHTGQGTDISIGSYLTNPSQAHNTGVDGLYSRKLKSRIANSTNHSRYADHELYMINVRGYLGMLTSHFIKRNYTEVSSPGLDPDLMNYCLSLPLELRTPYHGHSLYRKWVMTKYPKAASFTWTGTGVAFKRPAALAWLSMILRWGPRAALNRIGITLPESRFSNMNPASYWWRTNAAFRDFFASYYSQNMPNLPVSEALQADLKDMYEQGNITEKIQAITAIATIRYCAERQ